MCQAIPSILSCLWPAFHLKDTTKVNALWLSSPPTTSPCFCNTSESDDLKSDWRHEKTNTSTTFPCQSCSTGPGGFVCCCQGVVGFFFFSKKDQKKKKKKKADDQPRTPIAVIHVAAPLPQSFDVMSSYTHSADELEIIITPLNGSNPQGGVRGFRCSSHKTRSSENTGEGKAGIYRSWQGIAAAGWE